MAGSHGRVCPITPSVANATVPVSPVGTRRLVLQESFHRSERVSGMLATGSYLVGELTHGRAVSGGARGGVGRHRLALPVPLEFGTRFRTIRVLTEMARRVGMHALVVSVTIE